MLAEACLKDSSPSGCRKENTDACTKASQANQGLCNLITVNVPYNDEIGKEDGDKNEDYAIYRGMTDLGTKIKLQLYKVVALYGVGNTKRAYQHLWNARKLVSKHSGAVGSGIPGDGARFLHDIDMDIIRRMSSARSRPSLRNYADARRTYDKARHYREVLNGNKQLTDAVIAFFDEMRRS
jgi:hypothetical protein